MSSQHAGVRKYLGFCHTSFFFQYHPQAVLVEVVYDLSIVAVHSPRARLTGV